METTRLIEEYLEGNLSGEEKKAVEERAENDTDFRDLIHLHKEVNECIRSDEVFDLRNRITKISREYTGTDDRVVKKKIHSLFPLNHRIMYRVASLFVIMAAAGLILRYTVFSRLSSDRLYQRYYLAYETDIIQRSVEAGMTPLDKAIYVYNRGRYPDALKILDNILTNQTDNYVAWFYKGLTCLETGDPGRAVISFNVIPVNWNSPFAEHRDWYLALALLKADNPSEALRIFQKIASGDGYYARNAEKLLKRIKT
jgi:tetratricopeptide (TPR) repeat protein